MLVAAVRPAAGRAVVVGRVRFEADDDVPVSGCIAVAVGVHTEVRRFDAQQIVDGSDEIVQVSGKWLICIALFCVFWT